MSYRSRGASPFQSHAIASKTLARRTLGQKINKEKRIPEQQQQRAGAGTGPGALRRDSSLQEVVATVFRRYGDQLTSPPR